MANVFADSASIQLVLESLVRSNAVWPRVYVFMATIAKPFAMVHGEWERRSVLAWASGRSIDFEAARFVQASLREVEAVVNGSRMAATRALRQMADAGFIVPVARGVKGHASVYVLAPIPEIKNRVPIPGENVTPSPSGPKENRVTVRPENVTPSTEIGSHFRENRVTLFGVSPGKKSYQKIK